MGNRIIKESICLSDTIDQLSWFEEVVFYRLIVNCDDYGRFDGRIPAIKNLLFPLKTNITEKTVADAINKLSTVGLVMPYLWDGKPILQLATWDKHQTVRNKRSKYPAADGSMETSASENIRLISIEINCNQLNTDECNCSSNPIQYESNTNTNPNPTARTREGFDSFWKSYPKKKAKGDAEKAFSKLKPDEELLKTMLDAIEAQSRSPDWRKDGGQFIPYPATWLNQRRWEDETGGVPPSRFSGVTEVI